MAVVKKCDILLLSIGLIPENELSRNLRIQLDNATGGPVVNESMETSVKGIFACGNVVHVHDLMDYVTEESLRAGKCAAKYIKEADKKIGNIIKTSPKNGISYIIPHIIREENIEEKLPLFMRVRNIYHDAKLVVKGDGEKIKSIPKKYLAPGEMQHINLEKELLKGKKYKKLTVEVMKKQGGLLV